MISQFSYRLSVHVFSSFQKKKALIRENSFMPNPLKLSICGLMCICEMPWHILAQKNHWAPENMFLSVVLTDIKHEKTKKKSFSFFSHQHSYGWCRCPYELPLWLIVFAVLLDSWAWYVTPASLRTASKLKKKVVHYRIIWFLSLCQLHIFLFCHYFLCACPQMARKLTAALAASCELGPVSYLGFVASILTLQNIKT